MKKFLTVLAAAAIIVSVSGCEKVEEDKGNYKEGTYTATAVDPYNNEGNIASAKLVVNKDGKIESIYLDTTYNNGETTKKTLGNDYNMKTYNPSASGEWFEQVEKLEKYIVDAQGLGDITLKDDDTTDAVSGCTIKVDALIAVTEDVLNQAKK